MSSLADRNPSPPPEILDKDENFVPDRIGETVYSKRWLYKTLMCMVKLVREQGSLGTEELDVSNQAVMELDPKIEEDACMLWDMSANLEVAEFLCECNVAEIFLAIINSTRSPRLLEIVVGILGNMSSFNSTCQYISSSKHLVDATIMLSGCSDSCTLVQLFRLLTCGIVKESCRKEWIQPLEENESFMENLKSILENNLCRDVLRGVLEFLEKILQYHPTYCSLWSSDSYSLAIIECGKQLLKCNNNEDLDIFFTVVSTLCQEPSNVPVYGKYFGALSPLFNAYFLKIGDDEYLPQFSRVSAVIGTFALYGNLLFSGFVSPEHVSFDDNLFEAMLGICKMVTNLLRNLKRCEKQESSQQPSSSDVNSVTMAEDTNGSSVDDAEVADAWEVLLDAIVHAAKACLQFTKQESDIQILDQVINVKNSVDPVT